MDIAFRWFRRALWLCMCVGFSVVVPEALASGTVPAASVWKCGGSSYSYGSTPTEACRNDLVGTTAARSSGDSIYTAGAVNCAEYVATDSSVLCQTSYTWDYAPNGSHANFGPNNVYASREPAACPAGTTPVAGGCSCPDPKVVVDGACVTPPPPEGSCVSQAGKQSITNMTVGWSRTNPDVYDPTQVVGGMHVPASGTLICDQGCQRTTGQPAQGWVSQVPAANGLYRMAMDIVVTATGGSCDSPQPSDANSPIAPPIPCDGFMGVVNGVPKCVAPAGAPAASAVPLPPDTLKGNPKAGSDGSKGIGDQSRQPFDGNGGNGGGPPTTNDGSKPGSTGGGGGAGGGSSGGGSGTGAPGGGTKGSGTSGQNTDGGTCQLNPSAAGCGGAAAGQPDLYTKKTATFETALNDFKAQIQGSPLGTATGGFLTVQGGGACPTFSGHIPYINADVTIDQFCSEFATNALALLKLALMVVAGISAFRVAVL